MKNRKLVALSLIALMGIAACTSFPPLPSKETPGTSTPTAPSPSAPVTGIDVYAQSLDWEKCGAFQCATILVPLDWDDPQGETISLALKKLEARERNGERLGSLLVNPGGPGSSGIDLVEMAASTFSAELTDQYDVIGFDPRGVAASTPVACGTDADLDDYLLGGKPVIDEASFNLAVQRNKDFAELCLQTSGEVARNIDTVSAASDMDVIRHLVGDSKLNYLGYSYGTQLGATYAELFPQNIGRMVLDGAVDVLNDGEDTAVQQMEGFESAYAAYIEWCTGQSGCPLLAGGKEPVDQTLEWIAVANEQGYPSNNGRTVTGEQFMYGILMTMYSEGNWPVLSQAFDEVRTNGSAILMEYLGNLYLDRSDDGSYNSNLHLAFQAISCLDAVSEDEQSGYSDYVEFREYMTDLSPIFGPWAASGVGCEGWPFTAKNKVTSLANAASGDPVLVIGTTNDPATPFSWAENLAEDLGSPLLVYRGEGHTAYGRSNDCIVQAVDGFLLRGELPANRTTC